jgi:hypothetical protein
MYLYNVVPYFIFYKKIDSIWPLFVTITNKQGKTHSRNHASSKNMNNTDYVIHIQTENDTLLGRIERTSHDVAIEDVNRVRRVIIGALAAFAVVVSTVAIVVACL